MVRRLGIVLLAGLLILSAQVTRVPVVHAAGWVTGSFSNSAGSRNYKLWVPTGYDGSAAVPLVVMLHGCTQDPDQFAAGTQMNALADQHAFLVLYPAQPTSAHSNRCWAWFDAAHQSRGSGEPSILAGMVNGIRSAYNVADEQIYVAGLSAGAAMAVVLGCTYPDTFSAIGVHSGLEYGAATTELGAWPAMGTGGPNPTVQGDHCFTAMGSAARPVRTIVFHGLSDYVVRPVNGDQVLSQWARTNDRADDGSANNSITDTPGSTIPGTVPGGYNYTRYIYAGGLMEKWLVQSMGHAWSGGSASGSYTDPKGPNATEEMWRFFSAGSPPPPPPVVDTTPPILTLSPAGGSFASPVTVTLSMNESGTIYYTTDGSDPLSSGTRSSFANQGQVTFTSTSTLRAVAVDQAGNESAVQTQTYTIAQAGTTVTFVSVGAEDGYAAAANPAGTTGMIAVPTDLWVGDIADTPYRGIFSFDTSSLPDGATILSAEIKLIFTQSPVGNPSGGLGALVADVTSGCLGSACSLSASDFEAAVGAAEGVVFTAPPGGGKAGTAVSGTFSPEALLHINKTGKTQLKLRFLADQNGNGQSDWVFFAGGEHFMAGYRPVLTITYQ